MSGKLLFALALLLGSATGCTPKMAEPQGRKPLSDGKAAWSAACTDWDEWDKPAPPYRIHGNTYYVGTCGISAILVVGDDGLVLFDSGTVPGSKVVTDNIELLGYSAGDVKALFASHEHFDHVGGMARLQGLSGAPVYSGEAAVPVLLTGRDGADDPQAGMHDPMAPVASVRAVIDGQTVAAAGLTAKAFATPGHTPGAMSWSWQSCAGSDCATIVYADSLSPVSRDGYRFSDHPAYLARFREGLNSLSAADCDILLSPHPSASAMPTRLKSDDGLRDSAACTAYAASISARLDRRLAEEQK